TAGQFPAFSPKNTFAMFDENTLEMSMILPSAPTTAPHQAGSRGFGAIFVGVQLPYTSSIEYFNGSTSLGKYYVQPGPAGQPEFLGVLFDGKVVTNVEITLGNKVLFFVHDHQPVPGGPKDLLHGKDIAVVDDFVYSEPGAAIAAAQPAAVTIQPAIVHG